MVIMLILFTVGLFAQSAQFKEARTKYRLQTLSSKNKMTKTKRDSVIVRRPTINKPTIIKPTQAKTIKVERDSTKKKVLKK